MSDANQKTVQTYDEHVQDYVNHAPHDIGGSFKVWLDEAVRDLPKGARILEIGSAFGRDAAYLQNLGYRIECSDVAPSFVSLLQQKDFNARQLNALTDQLGGQYDLVLANAVLLHFTREETKLVVRKVYSALNSSGRFAFTVQRGRGEAWKENMNGAPRYFCYWEDDHIHKLVEQIGFTVPLLPVSEITQDAKWIHIIAKKGSSQ